VAERGGLEVICGPMFSGKTDELIDRFEHAEAAGRVAVALKPLRDGRHAPDRIVSHSGREIPARSVASLDGLFDGLFEGLDAPDVLLIDEIQFFEPELAAAVEALRDRGVHVVAVGLDRDFRRELFETTATVARAASPVTRLRGTCSRCGEPAVLTQRLLDGVPAPLDAPRLVVGDADLYEPRCERCWTEERLPSGDGARVLEP